MVEQQKTFRYKLDFYYQSALIYLVTLILYGAIRGNFVEQRFEYVLNDPLMYVILLFVLFSFVALFANLLRNRRLVLTEDALVFKTRWRERRVAVADMEWMHIGREARVQTGGRFQVIVFKLKHRRRVVRIRVGRYERDRELVQEIAKMAARVPRKRRPRWKRPIVTDQ